MLISQLSTDERVKRNRRAQGAKAVRRVDDHRRALVDDMELVRQREHLAKGVKEFRDMLEQAWRRKHS